MNFDAVLDIFFPPECLACGARLEAGTLCAPCRHAIGRPPPLAIENVGDGPGCYFLAAAGRYQDGVLRALICALKFGGIRSAALPLAEILARRVRAIPLPLRAYTVMPVPLSPRRLRERGFNQSALIASPLAASLGLPFDDQTLIRTGHRKPQSATGSRAARRENIRGCFALRDGSSHAHKDIILVDDVSTSGSTFRESVRTLSAHGTEAILALAVARA